MGHSFACMHWQCHIHHHHITHSSHSISAIGPAPHRGGKRREHWQCCVLVRPMFPAPAIIGVTRCNFEAGMASTADPHPTIVMQALLSSSTAFCCTWSQCCCRVYNKLHMVDDSSTALANLALSACNIAHFLRLASQTHRCCLRQLHHCNISSAMLQWVNVACMMIPLHACQRTRHCRRAKECQGVRSAPSPHHPRTCKLLLRAPTVHDAEAEHSTHTKVYNTHQIQARSM